MGRAFFVISWLVNVTLAFLSAAVLTFGVILHTSKGKLDPALLYGPYVDPYSFTLFYASLPAVNIALATASLTLLSAVTFPLRNLFTLVFFELSWTTVLLVLWIVSTVTMSLNSLASLFRPYFDVLLSLISCPFGCIATVVVECVSLATAVFLAGYLVALIWSACVASRKTSGTFLTMPLRQVLSSADPSEKSLPQAPLMLVVAPLGYSPQYGGTSPGSLYTTLPIMGQGQYFPTAPSAIHDPTGGALLNYASLPPSPPASPTHYPMEISSQGPSGYPTHSLLARHPSVVGTGLPNQPPYMLHPVQGNIAATGSISPTYSLPSPPISIAGHPTSPQGSPWG